MAERQKILVVDDEPDLQKFVRVRLEKNNYDVVTASDGEEALQLARQEKPDLIVLDVLLPKYSGFEVCERLKKDPELGRIPIIMLTVKDQPADIEFAKKIGAEAYISKPFEAELLLYNVKKLIGR